MPRVALVVEYDGSSFEGWQTQPGGRTVQDTLEAAIAVIAGEPVATICAGRTDAGVHARRQVVHFETAAARPPSAWVRGVNAALPPPIAVQHAVEVGDDFDARRSALRRAYVYAITCRPQRSPLTRERTAWVFRPLDVVAMREAAALLIGEHDFSSFRSSQCQARSPVRRLERLEIESRGELIALRIVGNAFLHHMVRNIASALVEVGSTRRPVSWLGEVLAARDRSVSSATLAAAGLVLTGVEYPAHHPVPSWPAQDTGPIAEWLGVQMPAALPPVAE